MAAAARELRKFHEAMLNHLVQYRGWFWIDGYSWLALAAFVVTGLAMGKDITSDHTLSLASVPFPIVVALSVRDVVAAGRRARRQEED